MPQGKHILGRSPTPRVFGTAKVGDRGQIVIPKEARDYVLFIEKEIYIFPSDTSITVTSFYHINDENLLQNGRTSPLLHF